MAVIQVSVGQDISWVLPGPARLPIGEPECELGDTCATTCKRRKMINDNDVTTPERPLLMRLLYANSAASFIYVQRSPQEELEYHPLGCWRFWIAAVAAAASPVQPSLVEADVAKTTIATLIVFVPIGSSPSKLTKKSFWRLQSEEEMLPEPSIMKSVSNCAPLEQSERLVAELEVNVSPDAVAAGIRSIA